MPRTRWGIAGNTFNQLSKQVPRWSTRSGPKRQYRNGERGRNTLSIAWCTKYFLRIMYIYIHTIHMYNVIGFVWKWKHSIFSIIISPSKRQFWGIFHVWVKSCGHRQLLCFALRTTGTCFGDQPTSQLFPQLESSWIPFQGDQGYQGAAWPWMPYLQGGGTPNHPSS